MRPSGNSRCGRCGEVVRADEPLCPRCLLDAVSAHDSRAGEEQLFQQALALEPEARVAFVHEATREHPSLRAAVLLLLEGYEEAGGDAAQTTQVDAPHARARWAAPTNEEPGTVIGHFRLVRLLGEGGMGSVWRAEQTAPVRRTVALKVIKLGMDTREVVRRFERERQTLALLSHPNIAQVFEAGATALGRPFFAMELVEGEPITAYCEDGDLPLEARLRLFQDVCAAVEHAHQKGVIHRDLKPSNILVARGAVKVIDFGVAKATQGTTDPSHTLHGRIVGTPAYMSPEQANTGGADVDTRADVYSLGAVLYELLTGTLPIDPARLATQDLAELQRILREAEPPTASTRLATVVRKGVESRKSVVPPATVTDPTGNGSRALSIRAGRLRGDLDRVVAKALRKDRAERYPSAAALSEDLRRYLGNEPVSAVPPSLVYHAGKFIRRHRLAVIAVTGVVLSLVIGILVSSMLAIQARRAAAREKLARQDMGRTTASLYSLLANNQGHDGHPELAALWAAKAAEASAEDPLEHDANLRRAALWTAQVPAPLRAFQSEFTEIRKLIFHPLERHLLAESRTGERQVWDIDRERLLAFGGAQLFSAAAWSVDGSLLAVAHREAPGIALHRFPDGTVVQSALHGSEGTNAISCLAFNVRGTLLAAGAGASVDVFRRGDDHVFRFLVTIPQPGAVQRIVFSPTDPHCLATCVTTNQAGLFVIDPVKPGYTVRFASESHVFQARRIDSVEPPWFDRTGTRLHLCRKTGGARDSETYGLVTYDVGSGSPLGPVLPLNGVVLGHHPDNRFVLCRHEGALKRETASVADASNGRDVGTVTFNRIVTVADFDSTGDRAMVCSEDGQALVLAAPDWKPEKRLALHQARVMGVAFAPGGRIAATAQAGGLVRLWRIQEPHRSLVRLGHDSRVALNPDGQFFALAGRSAVDATLVRSRVVSDLRRRTRGSCPGRSFRRRGLRHGCLRRRTSSGRRPGRCWAPGRCGVRARGRSPCHGQRGGRTAARGFRDQPGQCLLLELAHRGAARRCHFHPLRTAVDRLASQRPGNGRVLCRRAVPHPGSRHPARGPASPAELQLGVARSGQQRRTRL
jgi:serine/threonine protein kinase/WD40 repeat protein